MTSLAATGIAAKWCHRTWMACHHLTYSGAMSSFVYWLKAVEWGPLLCEVPLGRSTMWQCSIWQGGWNVPCPLNPLAQPPPPPPAWTPPLEPHRRQGGQGRIGIITSKALRTAVALSTASCYINMPHIYKDNFSVVKLSLTSFSVEVIVGTWHIISTSKTFVTV